MTVNDKLGRTWKQVVVSCCVVLPQHLPGENEENTRNIGQE